MFLFDQTPPPLHRGFGRAAGGERTPPRRTADSWRRPRGADKPPGGNQRRLLFGGRQEVGGKRPVVDGGVCLTSMLNCFCIRGLICLILVLMF